MTSAIRLFVILTSLVTVSQGFAQVDGGSPSGDGGPVAAPAPAPVAAPPPVVPVAPVQPAPPPPVVPPDPSKTPHFGEQRGSTPLKFDVTWGKGLTFKAGDLFSLTLRSRIQVQAFVSTPTDAALAAGAQDVVTSGILIRRARLVFMGHAFTKKLQYYIQLGFSDRDTEKDLRLPLRDAYITWQPLRDIGIRFGQMKVPYGRQRVVSSSALQMVDRATVVSELNMDRDVGAYLMSEDFLGAGGRLMYQVGVFSGQGRNRAPGPNSVMYFGRVQINPFGHFADHLIEGDHLRILKPRLAIGLNAAQNINSNRVLSTFGDVYTLGRFTYNHYGADLHFKLAGWSVISELMYRDPDSNFFEQTGKPTEWSRRGLGYFVQSGFMFKLPFEIVARWAEIFPIGVTDPTFRHSQEAAAGLNFYFWEHSLKVQTDYAYLFGDDTKAEKHQWRIQAQIFF